MGRGDITPIKQFQFKPGVSGNPGGRPKGPSMKKFARDYLENMTQEERIEFMNSISPDKVWEMAEGRAKQDIELEGEMVSKVIIADE
jgi:hypothetical protein